MPHLLMHLLGLDNVSGPWYAFWSGFGSDISEFALIGAGLTLYRRHTCHVDAPRFCWRPGVHPVPGTPYRACKRHHPHVPEQVTAGHIADAAAGAGRDHD